MKTLLPLWFALLCAPQTSAADPQVLVPRDGGVIVIKSLRHPEALAYASFVAAQKAYEQYRHDAPDAPLLFQMKTHSGTFDGLRLSIDGEHTRIAVPYDAEGQFTLPYDEAALQDRAVVLTDKRRGQIYWQPVIRTPGLAPGTLRLGDLRLDCRVQWALEKGSASFATKMATLMRGNCNSSSFVTLALPQPGMRVRLASKEQQQVLAPDGEHPPYVAHRTRWEPPFGNAAWPDDTLVDFLAPEEGFALDAQCQSAREKDAGDAYRQSYGTFDPNSCAWRPK
jgi:hypothetical protein